ncbi:MAG: redoxin [Planctomyces sp.]|nr:redoxin [Planctomyces sp.]MBA4039626.1 redoxin [Planctomyces sp.]MBA4120484.1 redoxin [Isosphaera sp.]
MANIQHTALAAALVMGVAGAAAITMFTQPAAAVAQNAAGRLVVGSKAPALNVDNWVKGDAVSTFEPGKVYVVEFWATWCPHCREAIPELTSLAKETGATIVGVASGERGDTATKLGTVQSFVKQQGPRLGYTIALDADGETNRAWMSAAGQNSIPTAFIVDGQGKIAFVGHPASSQFESTLTKLTTKQSASR